MKSCFQLSSQKRNALGSTLIEVLIALLLLAVGVLGAAAMQLNSLKYNQLAMVRSQATLAAYSIIDCMRANAPGVQAGSYLTSNSNNFTASGIAGSDLDAWRSTLGQLPNGTGSIAMSTASGYNQVTVTVSWDESRAATVNSGQAQTPAGSVTVVALL